MNQKNIARMLKMLGAERVNENPDWVMCSCPLAKWTHSKGTDTRPSFGVKVDKISHYHCFSCGRKGRLSTLPSYLSILSGKDLKSIRQFVTQHEHLGLEDFEPEDNHQEVAVMPEGVMNRFAKITKGPSGQFLKSRGVSPESAELFGLKFDPMKNRIILPVRGSGGLLVGIRGRTINPEDKIKYLTYKDMQMGGDAKYCGIWFGQQFKPKPGKLLILVEGELDAIMTRQALGKGAVWASMGASITKRQLETVKSMTTNPVALFFDSDNAGRDATERAAKELKKFVPKIYTITEWFGCKDPAELAQKGLLKKALKSMKEIR